MKKKDSFDSFDSFESDLGFNDNEPKKPNKKLIIIVSILFILVLTISFFVVTDLVSRNTEKEEQKQEQKLKEDERIKSQAEKLKEEDTAFLDSSQQKERNKKIDSLKTQKDLEEFKFNEGQSNKGSYTVKERNEEILTSNPITDYLNAKEEETSIFIVFPRDLDLEKYSSILKDLEGKGVNLYLGIYEKEQDYISLISSFTQLTKEPKVEPSLRGYLFKDGELKSYTLENADLLTWLNEVDSNV